MGGGFGFGKSSQKSTSSGYDRTFLNAMQAPFLEQLFSQGQQVAGQQMGSGPSGIYDQAVQSANAGVGQIYGGINNMFAGANALSPFTNPANSLANQQVGLLGQDISRQLNEQILPQLTSSAIGGGALGGSRGAIGAGLAAQGAQDALARGSLGIRSNAYNQAQQAAGLQGQLMQQAGQAQVGSAGDLYNLGLSPFQAQFAPLQALAGILGSPIMERASSNYGRSRGGSTSMTVG